MHPTRLSKISAADAFTLFEVMMATIVTLVAIVGLIQAVTIGSEMQDVARKQATAMQIIRNEIDGVHLQSWATVSAFPTSASITINSAGTGLQACTPAATGQSAFALTNYTTSYTPPFTKQANDDNTRLMALAQGFVCSLAITTITGRSNFLVLTYSVTWTGGNRQKTYTRSGTTYYGASGLNVYYRR
jgi:Tfp pilus assembly protein PilV